MADSGYVRLSFKQMQDVALKHLISGIDEDGPDNPSDNATLTAIGGYTEWVSKDSPIITLGWDWRMLSDNSLFRLERVSEPRSNVMLLSPALLDLGYEQSVLLLGAFVDTFDWQAETLDYINARYSSFVPAAPPEEMTRLLRERVE
jgi:hypothetical protein